MRQLEHAKKVIHETRLINELPFNARVAERTMQYPKVVKALEATVRCLDRLTANEMRLVELRADLRSATNEYKDALRQVGKQEPMDLPLTSTLSRARLKVDKLLEEIEKLLNDSEKGETPPPSASISLDNLYIDYEGGMLR